MPSATRTTLPIPGDVRALLHAPNYVHLATLRAGVSPRNHVVWVGLEGDHVLVCISDFTWKARDMRRDPCVALCRRPCEPLPHGDASGRVVEERPDDGCRYTDPISFKYTGAPFPSRGRDRVCFVIAVERADGRTLGFVHDPG